MLVGQKKRQLKAKPNTVCPRCQGFMERKLAIREGLNTRYWGNDKPFLSLGGVEVHHYMCIKCGNMSAYQFDTRARMVKRGR